MRETVPTVVIYPIIYSFFTPTSLLTQQANMSHILSFLICMFWSTVQFLSFVFLFRHPNPSIFSVCNKSDIPPLQRKRKQKLYTKYH